MRISIFTDEISPDIPRALTLASAWELEYVELRSLPGGRFPRLPDAELEDVGRRLADSDLTLSGVSPGFFKCPFEDPIVADEMANALPRACEWALRLGTERISSFAFRRVDGDVLPAQVIDLMTEMADRVSAAGCRLTVENEAICWGGSGLETTDIMDLMQRPEVGLCYDPGNSVRSGVASPFPNEYGRLRHRISHLHMKNYDSAGECWSLMETGAVDWRGQLRALRDDGYEGFALIETHTDVSVHEFIPLEDGAATDTSGLAPKEANSLRNLEFVRACLAS